MSDASAIEWTDTTWNPTTGCDKVSPGCGLARPGSDDEETGRTGGCYAMTMARRLKAMGQAKYQNDGNPRTSGPGFGVTMHADAVAAPLSWRKPRKVFVNSMSDLFHDQVDADFIVRVFAVMAATPQHTYQVLTKRHGRMQSLLNAPDFRHQVYDLAALNYDKAGRFDPYRFADPDMIPVSYAAPDGQRRDDSDWWPLPNVWLGVSVETQQWANIRIPALLDTPAAIRWISAEPLLGPVDLTRISRPSGQQPELVWDVLNQRYGVPGRWQAPMRAEARLDWVVTGGESGSDARPAHPDWFRSIRDQCQAAGVAYLHKQHGAYAPVTDVPKHGDVWVDLEGSTRRWEPFDGHVRRGVHEFRDQGAVLVRRVGKKMAGRELDGRTWDEYPGGAS